MNSAPRPTICWSCGFTYLHAARFERRRRIEVISKTLHCPLCYVECERPTAASERKAKQRAAADLLAKIGHPWAALA